MKRKYRISGCHLLLNAVFSLGFILTSPNSIAQQETQNPKGFSKGKQVQHEKFSVAKIVERATQGRKVKELLKDASHSSLTSMELLPTLPASIKPMGKDGKVNPEWVKWTSQNTFEVSLTDLEKAYSLLEMHPNGTLYLCDPAMKARDSMYFWLKVEIDSGHIKTATPRQ